MLLPLFVGTLAAAQVAIEPQVPIGPQAPPEQILRAPLPDRPHRAPQPSSSAAPPQAERVPIDLGPEAPTSAAPPQQIDILVPPPAPEAANEAVLKECEDKREAGVVAGEIVVCRELAVPTDQLYSGSREHWMKAYAARTQGPNTPDVDNSGLPPGMFGATITIIGCFIPPCPKPPALMIDVEAIETPPAGSDAERVAQGLAPVEDDMAPLSEEARRRVEADLGLPEAPRKE